MSGDDRRGLSDRDPGFRPSAKQILGGVIALIALIFVLQNTQEVRVHVLFLHVDANLWLLLLVMFALGAGVATLLHWRGRRKS